MSKHTPGPWERVPTNKHHGPWICDNDGNTVCDLYFIDHGKVRVHGGDRAEANARLIAASPEMYDSSKPLAELVAEFSGPDDATIAVTVGELRRLAAAIAKAEGRT